MTIINLYFAFARIPCSLRHKDEWRGEHAEVTTFFEITREGRIIIKSEINEIKACQNVLKDLVNMLI